MSLGVSSAKVRRSLAAQRAIQDRDEAISLNPQYAEGSISGVLGENLFKCALKFGYLGVVLPENEIPWVQANPLQC